MTNMYTYCKPVGPHRQCSIARQSRIDLNGSRYEPADPGDFAHLRGSRAICHIEPDDNEKAFDDPLYLGGARFFALAVR